MLAVALTVAAAYYGTTLILRLLDPVTKQRSAALEKSKRFKNKRVRRPSPPPRPRPSPSHAAAACMLIAAVH